MKHLYRLPGAVLALLLGLTCCAPARHTAQAPPHARRAYEHAQRRHARERHHYHLNPFSLPWN